MNELLRVFRGPAGPVLLGCLVAQMGLGCVYFFGVTLRYIVKDFDWSVTAFAASTFPLLLGYAIGSPVVGTLTDRFGGKRVMSVAALLLAATFVGIARMETLFEFYMLSLALGIALVGLGDIPVAAITSRWVKRGRGLALGFVYTGSNLGGTVVPLIAVGVATRTSWRDALIAIAGLVVVMILPVVWLTVREPPVDFVPEADPHEPEAPSDDGLDLAAAVRTRSFWVLFAALVLFYFYYLGVNHHLANHLAEIGYSDGKAAASFAGAAFVGIAGKLAIGLLADRIAHKKALLLNFGVMAAASGLLLGVASPALLPFFLIAHGFTVAAENVLLPLIVADCFGVRHMAQIYGVLMIALFPGGTLGPLFAARVFDELGSYQSAFAIFALLNLVTVVMLLAVRDERVN
ncbi:MAG: MFS transporter [Deltaproteobacteria bacterium]|nr:MFS transporter [Deltaproteobacteria bacterium]MBW2447494.1 MFS transporter [Deltaproteobacteria bacterium]